MSRRRGPPLETIEERRELYDDLVEVMEDIESLDATELDNERDFDESVELANAIVVKEVS